MSQVSLGRPEFVPGTPPGHPTAKFLYVIFSINPGFLCLLSRTTVYFEAICITAAGFRSSNRLLLKESQFLSGIFRGGGKNVTMVFAPPLGWAKTALSKNFFFAFRITRFRLHATAFRMKCRKRNSLRDWQDSVSVTYAKTNVEKRPYLNCS